MDEEHRNWFVGADWASQSHHVVLTDARGGKVAERGFDRGGEGLAEMATRICKHAGAAEPAVIGIVIEVPHGPLVEGFMERGFPVHAINPKQLDRFRDRFSSAGAKDDSRDAEVLASALRTDPRCLRRLEPIDPTVVELREWSRIAENLRHDRNRLGNRVLELLWRYYPQMLELTDDVAGPGSSTSGLPTPTIRRELRRRTAIEPVIGHLKADGLFERNHLWGEIKAVLVAAGHNFRTFRRMVEGISLRAHRHGPVYAKPTRGRTLAVA